MFHIFNSSTEEQKQEGLKFKDSLVTQWSPRLYLFLFSWQWQNIPSSGKGGFTQFTVWEGSMVLGNWGSWSRFACTVRKRRVMTADARVAYSFHTAHGMINLLKWAKGISDLLHVFLRWGDAMPWFYNVCVCTRTHVCCPGKLQF